MVMVVVALLLLLLFVVVVFEARNQQSRIDFPVWKDHTKVI